MPSSVQWELLRDAVKDCYRRIFEQLCLEAAQGELIHNDDTTMRGLELNGKKKAGEPLREDAPERSGVYTTGILSMASTRPTIALFFTGPRHSGDNLRDLLARRMPDLPEPIQMCDAISHNMPQELKTIVANCLSHGRRKFVELAEVFPDEVKHILHELKKVYRTDAAAKRFKLSPPLRLQLHQRRSEPVMTELHDWLTRQLEEKKVEPNSSLGNAMKYMLKHWDKLTLFLRREGAPLDNNIAERALKMAIRHRKNSLYYRSELGAKVGDIYMSLIHTCQFATVDPLEYLTVTLKNASQVTENPARWLPWNYREQLDPS